MEHGKELILQAVNVIIFCIAISLLTRQVRTYFAVLDEMKQNYSDSDELYVSTYSSSDYVRYEQLMASLLGELDYDLEINGYLISKYSHSVDQIESYGIADSDYEKSYAYDTAGNVTRIIYTSVGG